MAAIVDDWVIYNDQVNTAFYEAIAANTEVFNAASGNAILMRTNEVLGNYGRRSVFDVLEPWARRDNTSESSATATDPTQDEQVSVKLNRKAIVDRTYDVVKKAGYSTAEYAQILGQQLAADKLQKMTNSVIKSLQAGLAANADSQYDVGGTATASTMKFSVLNSALNKMGDRREKIKLIVMHSQPWSELIADGITNLPALDTVTGGMITTDVVPQFGRKVLITDDASLTASVSSGDDYYTLCLVEEAAVLTESEPQTLVNDNVTGLENLVLRTQVEAAWNCELKGFKWDMANGGANPYRRAA